MRVQRFQFENPATGVSKDISEGLIWQYDNAPAEVSLMLSKAAWYRENFDEFFSDWYTDVFNLFTCNEFGISVWARILNIPLQVEGEEDIPIKPLWGFGPDAGNWSGDYAQNFGGANFTDEGGLELSLDEKRFILLLCFYKSQSNLGTFKINDFLSTIVYLVNDGAGSINLIDNFDMTCTYNFDFTPRGVFLQALVDYAVLPKPACVKINIITP